MTDMEYSGMTPDQFFDALDEVFGTDDGYIHHLERIKTLKEENEAPDFIKKIYTLYALEEENKKLKEENKKLKEEVDNKESAEGDLLVKMLTLSQEIKKLEERQSIMSAMADSHIQDINEVHTEAGYLVTQYKENIKDLKQQLEEVGIEPCVSDDEEDKVE